MSPSSEATSPKLFYSYSHQDNKYRKDMESSLALLKRNGHLTTWSDYEILPGRDISAEITAAMEEADIMVFLFSLDFIASPECMKEWDRAKCLSDQGRLLFRIPIILTPCAWKDVLQSDLVKALPDDGKPVSDFRDRAAAWQQIYLGIRRVVETLQKAVCPREPFSASLSQTEFIFGHTASLPDLYVFPTLAHPQLRPTAKLQFRDRTISYDQLLEKDYTIVHGDDVSGKTSLIRHLFLTLSLYHCKNRRPVLIDMENISGLSDEQIVETCYQAQYVGDYKYWECSSQNVALIDNLCPDRKHMQFMEYAKKRFNKVIVTVSSQIYHSYFYDDARFADFYAVEIRPLNHHQQEALVRKALLLSHHNPTLPDGLVDQAESKVNAVVISNRIVPRYPFYVLSILQSEERFMPDVPLTSFGHCYYILIVAHLVKSGVSRKDDDINACFNFLERLAYWVFSATQPGSDGRGELDEFILSYREQYYIADSLVNRLRHTEYGILNEEGKFSRDYVYYYFLGRFLANEKDAQQPTVQRLCRDNHIGDNYLIVLFLIHHTSDDAIIDEVLVSSSTVI